MGFLGRGITWIKNFFNRSIFDPQRPLLNIGGPRLILQVRFQDKPKTTDFHQGASRGQKCFDWKKILPRDSSPRKRPRYRFSAGF